HKVSYPVPPTNAGGMRRNAPGRPACCAGGIRGNRMDWKGRALTAVFRTGPSAALALRDAPQAPGRPPAPAAFSHFRHGIETVRAARAAAGDAEERQEAALPEAVARNRLVAVFGTGRQVPAGIADETGKRQLIEPDQ